MLKVGELYYNPSLRVFFRVKARKSEVMCSELPGAYQCIFSKKLVHNPLSDTCIRFRLDGEEAAKYECNSRDREDKINVRFEKERIRMSLFIVRYLTKRGFINP